MDGELVGLPSDFLAKRFGADPEKVTEKIAKYRQDWHEHPRPASAHGELERTIRA